MSLRLTYLIEELSPYVNKAVTETAADPNKSAQILVQLQENTPNAKIQFIQAFHVLKDLMSGLRVNRRHSVRTSSDFEHVLAEIRNELENRMFSARLKGHIQLSFHIYQGIIEKVEETRTQREHARKSQVTSRTY